MKFGKSFEKALEDHDIPDEWKAVAIQYKSLKKCINKVVKELESLGLTTEAIKTLLESSKDQGGSGKAPTATIEYIFDGTTRSIEPIIQFTVDVEDARLAGLSSTTRTVLRDLLKSAAATGDNRRLRSGKNAYDPVASAASEEKAEEILLDSDPKRSHSPELASELLGGPRTIHITLNSDLEFFDMLSDEVDKLDNLQSREKSMVLANIDQLGTQISNLVRPNNKGKLNPSLDAWRKVLRLYEDAGIFRASTELQRRNYSPEVASKQFVWFMDQVQRQGILPDSPRTAQSRALYQTFTVLNSAILQQVTFHHMNQQAMNKILKKFDKRTALTAKTTFPMFMASDPFFGNGLAQAMHFALASNIMAVVPQLDDFECPVCTSITVKPVRLSCSHVFCVRCLIKLQLAKENHCPICRRENVLEADSTNIDYALLNFLKMYFPSEARQKQHDNEREQLKATAAANGLDGKACNIM